MNNWTREQTIVALSVYCKIPFNKASNNNPEIVKAAKLIGRTPVAVKMRDDVLRSDILFRYINNEDVSNSDIKWIREEFGTDFNAIKQESIILEKKFVCESLDNFYEQLMVSKQSNETM